MGSILPKNERNYQNIGEKKKRKKNTEPSGIEKDWVDEMRREWEVANKSAKVTYLVTEPPR